MTTVPTAVEVVRHRRSERALRRQHRLRLAAAAGGACVATIGLLVLAGWALDLESLMSPGPDEASMKIHTAIALLEGGLLIMVAARWEGLRAGAWLAALMGVIPGLTLVEYLTGRSLGVDTLFGEGATDVTAYPGRMAPLTAVALSTLALALAATFRRRMTAAQLGAAVVLGVAMLALVGYAFGVEVLYQIQEFTSVKINTAASLGIAGLSVLALNTSGGVLSILVGTTAGGIVGRALLPPLVALQVVASGLVLLGVTQDVYSYRFGFALLTMINIVAGVALVLVLAFALRTSDLRRAALEEAHEQSAELAAANVVLNDFAAMAAHDLRGPLGAVRGYAELLEDALAGASPEERELLTRIQRAAGRGDEMITDLLAFARLGSHPLAMERVDLAKEVREVGAEVAEAQGRALELAIGELPAVKGDRSLLRTLLENVLGNAVKYVPQDRPCRVAVAMTRTGKEVAISFTDNGDGIEEAERDRLLGMFERGGNNHDVPGTGIGLAICARVAECHGGRFRIESGPEGGARFVLSLPQS